MKKPICNFCLIPMEPSGQTLVKPGKPNRYITTTHTCPECGKIHDTPQHIIDNARRPPSPSKPKPKQRVTYADAKKMLERMEWKTKIKLQNNFEYVQDYAGGSQKFINSELVEMIIRKLTR